MVVWRICSSRHTAFDGEGARIHGGRWNRAGSAVVYTSESLSLAAMELLVHLDPRLLPSDLVCISAELPRDVKIQLVDAADLPANWRDYPAAEELKDVGSRWLSSGESAVLSVPSAVIPQERNYLLNPAHPGFRRIKASKPVPFRLDARLLR